MYTKFAKPVGNNGKQLKQHHHVKLDDEFHFDCQIWRVFLQGYRDTAVCRPMTDVDRRTPITDLKFYSDASANPKYGMGAYFNNRWVFAQWEPGYIKRSVRGGMEPSIEYLELYALTAALLTWGEYLKNDSYLIYCDNESVVSMINSTVSSCKNCMYLLSFILSLPHICSDSFTDNLMDLLMV